MSNVKKLLDLAAVTATANGNGPIFYGANVLSADVTINVSARSGTTPSIIFKVQREGLDGNWYDLHTFPAATNVGTLTANVEVGTRVCQTRNANLRIAWTVGGTTPSFTFTTQLVAKP